MPTKSLPKLGELYEIKPGAKRVIESSGVGTWVNGVAYSIGDDGTPIRDERSAADEERNLAAQHRSTIWTIPGLPWEKDRH